MVVKDINEAVLDPIYWHPKCKNFELLDWDKFLASNNPSPPQIFDPPQRSTFPVYNYLFSLHLIWSRRSPACQPFAFLCHSCCGPVPKSGKLSEDAIYTDLLGPSPDSSKIPEPLRNALFWTDFNSVPETLISFNRYSWRSQTSKEEGGGGRVIGLGRMQYDWTRDRTCMGYVFAKGSYDSTIAFQESPDKKWLAATVFKNPNNAEESVSWIFFYVIQEGDNVFQNRDGDAIDYLKPGDLIRLTWSGSDENPYDTSTLKYMYHPRRVATYNEETQQVEYNTEHHKALVEKATKKRECCWMLQTCCNCFGCCWCVSKEARWDHDVTFLCNRQAYLSASSSAPVMGEEIERL